MVGLSKLGMVEARFESDFKPIHLRDNVIVAALSAFISCPSFPFIASILSAFAKVAFTSFWVVAVVVPPDWLSYQLWAAFCLHKHHLSHPRS